MIFYNLDIISMVIGYYNLNKNYYIIYESK